MTPIPAQDRERSTLVLQCDSGQGWGTRNRGDVSLKRDRHFAQLRRWRNRWADAEPHTRFRILDSATGEVLA